MPVIFTTLFSSAWSLIKRALDYPWQAALIIALLACGWLYMGKERALATIAKRDATIVQMTAASNIATAAQIALNKVNTDKQTQIARLTDEDETNRRDVADRSSDYASRMRAKDYCREASATPQGDFTKGDNSASDTSIVVSEADFRILTDNTARLMDVKAWGDALIQADLAAPVTLPEQSE